MMRARSYQWLGFLSVLACSSGAEPRTEPRGDAPEGARLVRSSLAHEQASAPEADVTQLGSDNRQFAFELYGQLRKGDENLFFSPYSISVALAMTYAGARENTAREIAEALHFTLPDERLHAAFNTLDHTLEGREAQLPDGQQTEAGFRLDTVNGLFGPKDELKPMFLDVLARHYDAGMYQMGFGDPELARTSVNRWVADKTEQRIDELLPEGSIDTRVALILVNAIYFKAAWHNKFNPEATKPALFHAPAGDLTVPMMQGPGERYGRGADFQAVTVPYASEGVHAVFILPDEGKLADVEGRLATGLFDDAMAALTRTAVVVQLPRFQFKSEHGLNAPLMALGMRDAFSLSDADFTGIFTAPGVAIKAIFHDAFVSMDEEGTEAAAATAVVFGRKGAEKTELFTADRPFLFFIYDEPTGQILFAGRVLTPA